MLSYISVRNFAIIENIEVTFKEGMTTLTGETGAGKSLLIDAIGLLLGDRATSNVVRTGFDKATVQGIFIYLTNEVKEILRELDIPLDEDALLIKREITITSNNIIKLNNVVVTLTDLKKITSKLADIHTQYDTQRLINPETYLSLIDGFQKDAIDQLIINYQEKLSNYKDALKKLKILEQKNNDIHERLDLLKFQKNELESYQLTDGEEEELEEMVKRMENYDQIFKHLNQTIVTLDDMNAVNGVYQAKKELDSITSYGEIYEELSKRLDQSFYELEDILETLKEEASSLDFDPRELDQSMERLNDLEKIKRKYRKDIPELINYLDEITEDIETIDHFDYRIEKEKERVLQARNLVIEEANLLTMKRQEIAKKLSKELLDVLADLELKDTLFDVTFTSHVSDDLTSSTGFYEDGIDEVDFLLSTNIGEPLKSLSKAASGGEMSRIMLGMKTLLVKSLDLSLIIFDEIDTGVSGFVANQVAKKMAEISKRTQVIAITHIAQVAATSDHHLFVSKHSEGGRTYAKIKELTYEEQVLEIATMISGDEVSNSAKESAQLLLKNAENGK
ncbi:MAG: DNA repair protein RecN [Candidatus Izemoplasmataceae bacterium]